MKITVFVDESHSRVSMKRHSETDKEVDISEKEWQDILDADISEIATKILNIINERWN